MEIKKIIVGKLEENCYIIEKNGKNLIVDPGDNVDNIVENLSYPPLAILITHRHFDHIGAINPLLEKYDIPVFEYNNLGEGDLTIENFNIEIIYTPGHTSDCITYYFKNENVMFTGDFLFKDTIGRTDLETGSIVKMKESINKIKKYDDNIIVYPGHGDSTILGYEKRNNVYFN